MSSKIRAGRVSVFERWVREKWVDGIFFWAVGVLMTGLLGSGIWIAQSIVGQLGTLVGVISLVLFSCIASFVLGLTLIRYRPCLALDLVGRFGLSNRAILCWLFKISMSLYIIVAMKEEDTLVSSALDDLLHSFVDRIRCLRWIFEAVDGQDEPDRQLSAIRHIVANREQFRAILGAEEPLNTLDVIRKSTVLDSRVRREAGKWFEHLRAETSSCPFS